MKKIFKIFVISIGIFVVLFIGFFLLIKRLDARAVELKDFYTFTYPVTEPTLLPSKFVHGQRFYIKVPATTGDTLLGFCDTGGGISFMLPDVVRRLGLGPKIKRGLLKGMMPVRYIPFSAVVSDPRIPPPLPSRTLVLRRPVARIKRPYLLVPAMKGELKFMEESMEFDIFFGQHFFMGKSWTIDYPKEEVWVNTPVPPADEGKPGVLKLGFKKNSNNELIFGHPRMFIEVDGEKIDVLFDTGASFVLSDNGKKMFNTTEKTLGGSFIANSVMNKWREKHPDWKYYPGADLAGDVIEVPLVKIAGYEVGPVLFARRPDEAWWENMIHSMDKVVRGAVGGSALQYFSVTIDYNSELIRFER